MRVSPFPPPSSCAPPAGASACHRGRVAELLRLPRGGTTKLSIGGAAADAYFRSLSDRIGRPARDADFAVYGDAVQVIPARTGLELNVPHAARAILQAATRPTNRIARLTIARAAPERTTAEALAMGIDRRMSSYKTYYSGTTDRITNLQLGVRALDGTLVPPGGTFSLNDAIGERTAERGFRSAPVIIGNEYAEEVGGGTSQVATTAFNAAWEAGLRITERHPHSLYISRYQLGRDATVYWPSLDLKFVNDTDEVGAGEGVRRERRDQHRDLRGREPPDRELRDPAGGHGPGSGRADRGSRRSRRARRAVDEEGTAPTRTSATREIYAADGELIRSETWTTSYEGEKRVVRIGTKVAEPKPEEGRGRHDHHGHAPPATEPKNRP